MQKLFRLATLLLAAFVIASATVTAGSAQATREVTVGLVSPTSGEWPTYVADEMGFFKRYRIDPKFIVVGSAAAAAQQAIAGSIDVAEVSSTQIVEAVQNGATLRYIVERMSTPPYTMLAQKQYKRYADLKGKTVIIGGPADITVLFTEKMLASGGLKMSDVDFTYAGGTTERYAALKSGSVAAAILFPPFDYRAADEGYSVLGGLQAVFPKFPFIGWAVTDKYAQTHADLLVDFTKGYLRGVRWLNDPANRAKAIEILLRRTASTPSDAERSYDIMVGSKIKAFPPDGVTAPKTFASVLDELARIKIVTPPLKAPTDFYDNRFVEQANAQLRRER
jgi:ABC-type nitrate/sulfonate/bicarbonate transport system substrate-binding protein